MNFTFEGFDSKALYFNATICYCSRCFKQKNSVDQLEELNLLLLRDVLHFEPKCKSTTRKVCKEFQDVRNLTNNDYVLHQLRRTIKPKDKRASGSRERDKWSGKTDNLRVKV